MKGIGARAHRARQLPRRRWKAFVKSSCSDAAPSPYCDPLSLPSWSYPAMSPPCVPEPLPPPCSPLPRALPVGEEMGDPLVGEEGGAWRASTTGSPVLYLCKSHSGRVNTVKGEKCAHALQVRTIAPCTYLET